MSLSQVGVPGQEVDVLHGGDVDPSGRLLSVAEIQQAFRDLRQQERPRKRPPTPPLEGEAPGRRVDAGPASGSAHRLGDTGPAAVADDIDTARGADIPRPDTSLALAGPLAEVGVERDWIAVVAAHSGAGASTVALAITDAISAAGRPVNLVESAHPCRSGLIAAASAELGTDPTGAWRRGSRQLATVFRRVGDVTPQGWPESGADEGLVTVLDLGLPAPQNISRLAVDQPTFVVVCRPTIPGVRLAEHLLAQLGAARVVVAAVGHRRWPGEVLASLGPRLRALREQGRVVAVPEDGRLQVTGPTHCALPKPVVTAGRAVLALIDVAFPGAVTASAQSAPRRKGTTR